MSSHGTFNVLDDDWADDYMDMGSVMGPRSDRGYGKWRRFRRVGISTCYTRVNWGARYLFHPSTT